MQTTTHDFVNRDMFRLLGDSWNEYNRRNDVMKDAYTEGCYEFPRELNERRVSWGTDVTRDTQSSPEYSPLKTRRSTPSRYGSDDSSDKGKRGNRIPPGSGRPEGNAAPVRDVMQVGWWKSGVKAQTTHDNTSPQRPPLARSRSADNTSPHPVRVRSASDSPLPSPSLADVPPEPLFLDEPLPMPRYGPSPYPRDTVMIAEYHSAQADDLWQIPTRRVITTTDTPPEASKRHSSEFNHTSYSDLRIETGYHTVKEPRRKSDERITGVYERGKTLGRRHSARPLIVLDLDGVLWERFSREVKFADDARQFLTSCFRVADVGFYSSSTFRNIIEAYTELLTDEQQEQAAFLWTRNMCERDETSTNTHATVKPLSKVFAKYPQYNASRTVFVDDSESKMAPNDSENVIIKAADESLSSVFLRILERLGLQDTPIKVH